MAYILLQNATTKHFHFVNRWRMYVTKCRITNIPCINGVRGAESQKHRSGDLDNCRTDNHLSYIHCTIRSEVVPGVLRVVEEGFYNQEWDMKPTEKRTRKGDRRIQRLEQKETAVFACRFAGMERCAPECVAV